MCGAGEVFCGIGVVRVEQWRGDEGEEQGEGCLGGSAEDAMSEGELAEWRQVGRVFRGEGIGWGDFDFVRLV